MGRRISRGSSAIMLMSSWSGICPRLSLNSRALGLAHENISSAELMAAKERTSSTVSRCEKKSRSSDSTPARERASLALRQVDHLVQW
jgi:hypothetical protein